MLLVFEKEKDYYYKIEFLAKKNTSYFKSRPISLLCQIAAYSPVDMVISIQNFAVGSICVEDFYTILPNAKSIDDHPLLNLNITDVKKLIDFFNPRRSGLGFGVLKFLRARVSRLRSENYIRKI